MNKILVIGSHNIDTTLYIDEFPSEGETLSTIGYKVDAGGKGFNQAIAIKKSGGDVSYLTALNVNDPSSKIILDEINKYHLESKIIESDKPNGSAYIVVNSKGENKIVINAGANSSVLSNSLDDTFINQFEYIVLQNEIPQETNEYIFNKYKDKTIIYNPSPLRKIKNEHYSSISYLVLNEHEISFFSDKSTYEAMAKDILERGVKNVVLTLGENGSILFSKDECIKVVARKVKVVDTVAAGDTYLGYFVSMLSKGKSKKEAMEIASIASSITVSREGAIDAIPFIEEINN